jgi:ureidoglycolate lyase
MKVKIEKLTPAAFADFGSYFNIYEVDSDKSGDFAYYPDQAAVLFDNSNLTGLSVCGINKRKMVVDILEIHEHTEEAEFIIDADCAVLVGGRSGYTPDSSLFKAFLVPKGTLIRFKKFVWHFVPFPVDSVRAMVMTVLPPYTYTNDGFVVRLEEAVELYLD